MTHRTGITFDLTTGHVTRTPVSQQPRFVVVRGSEDGLLVWDGRTWASRPRLSAGRVYTTRFAAEGAARLLAKSSPADGFWGAPYVHEVADPTATARKPQVRQPVAAYSAAATLSQRSTRKGRKAANRKLAAAMRAAGIPITADTWARAKAGTLA